MNWKKEAEEQARLNGMGAEREARQLARINELESKNAKLRDMLDTYRGTFTPRGQYTEHPELKARCEALLWPKRA